MPFDPRSNRPSRRYIATPHDTAGAALFWVLVGIAVLGAWVIASSASLFQGHTPAVPEQIRIVVLEPPKN